MKLTKNFWLRIVPILVIVCVTILMSLAIYDGMIGSERERCWEQLEIATMSTAEKMRVRLTDNLNFLEAVSDAYILTHNIGQEKRVADYLMSVMEMTIFERLDVVFKDGRILTQTGEEVWIEGDLSFQELLDKGKHISPRQTCPFTGREVIYCFNPIQGVDGVQALLCGTIDCEDLGKQFEVFTYKGEAQMFLIDCADGNYLLDNWHSELGNIYNLGVREGNKDKEGEIIDMVPAIINGEEARFVYVSKTNGEYSYQYQTPVKGFNWTLCVAVQENVIFAHAHKLERLLFTVGIVEVLILCIYLVWNIWLSTVSVRSEERTKQLELERATNAAKAKFISNMSHDVRTPINGIVGMLRIIKNHRQEAEVVDDCLQKIEISTKYLSTLASDILDINEIESDKFTLEFTTMNLTKMAEELSVVIEEKAKEAKVEFFIDYSQIKHPWVLSSVVHVKRILVNLIGNAIKYSKDKEGKVWVTIEEGETVADKVLYRFVIKDNGIGIAEEFQHRMYNPFAQEKVGARSAYQGYGLGLTIVNQLVKKMEGTIEVESKKEQGSTFTVTLPFKQTQEERDEVPNKDVVVDLQGVRILVVEDNEMNLEIAEVLLSDAGANVTSATNGKIAVEIFEKSEPETYDLILMDIMMPEMDGCEATEAIRNLDRMDAKKIPIVAMTASAFTEEIKRCKEAGMNEHIAKPLDIDKLMILVEKYCVKTQDNEQIRGK